MSCELHPKIFASSKVFDISFSYKAVLFSELKQFRSYIEILDLKVLVYNHLFDCLFGDCSAYKIVRSVVIGSVWPALPQRF